MIKFSCFSFFNIFKTIKRHRSGYQCKIVTRNHSFGGSDYRAQLMKLQPLVHPPQMDLYSEFNSQHFYTETNLERRKEKFES